MLFEILHDIACDLRRLQRTHIRAGCQFFVSRHHRGHVGGIERGNVRAVGCLGIGGDIRDESRRRQGCLVRALGNLRVLGDKGFYLWLLGCGVLRISIAGNDRLGDDRAGIGCELIPSGLRARHVEIGSDLQHFLGQSLAEQAGQPRKLNGVCVQVILYGRDLRQRPGNVDLREHRLHFRFRKPAVQEGLDLREQRNVLGKRTLIHRGADAV